MPERERYMRLRGDGKNVNRYRVNHENNAVHLYVDVLGEYTLLDLISFVAEQGALSGDVTFNGGCFVITLPATPEDVARWEQADAKQEERGRESRLAWYERLRAEFEGDADV